MGREERKAKTKTKQSKTQRPIFIYLSLLLFLRDLLSIRYVPSSLLSVGDIKVNKIDTSLWSLKAMLQMKFV